MLSGEEDLGRNDRHLIAFQRGAFGTPGKAKRPQVAVLSRNASPEGAARERVVAAEEVQRWQREAREVSKSL